MIKTADELLMCGHSVYDREIEVEDGFVWVRWRCVEKEWTGWARVGMIPDKTKVWMEN